MSGKEHEFVSVIQKSKVSKETYVILGCKKGGGGKYKQYKDKLGYKSTRTINCRYPFKLKGLSFIY